MKKTFHLILIKPVRYDADGYPIEGVNPAENGIIRMKSRLDRRPDLR